jgi:hypothetical protein
MHHRRHRGHHHHPRQHHHRRGIVIVIATIKVIVAIIAVSLSPVMLEAGEPAFFAVGVWGSLCNSLTTHLASGFEFGLGIVGQT